MSGHGSRPAPYALTADELRRLGREAVDLAAAHLAGIRERPVYRPMTGAERGALLERPLPSKGADPGSILEFLRDHVLPHPMGNGHPRFFGWVNSPPAMLAVLTEILAGAMNPSCAGGDHAAIHMERSAVRWLMELVGFPVEGSAGLLLTGGSMASLTALAAARHRAARRAGWDVRAEGLQKGRPPMTIYVSSEGHACLRKSAELLGLGSEAVRTIPAGADHRMDVAALASAIRRDRGSGMNPFCVAATAGTVNTGAVDPIAGLVDLCRREEIWLHVDGAYGALGVLDPATRRLYEGIDQADSLALDPHKWMSVPVECGAVLVRDGALLRDAFSLVPAYLRTEEGRGFGGPPWYSEYGFQQTRGYRAMKLWVTMAHAGRDGIASVVVRHNVLARALERMIRAAPDLELLAPVTLSIVCFRFRSPELGASDEEMDALNQRIVEEVQAGGEAFVTGTRVGGRAAIRACILHYDTEEDDLEAMIRAVRGAGGRLARASRRAE